jgi:hypothetical protein
MPTNKNIVNASFHLWRKRLRLLVLLLFHIAPLRNVFLKSIGTVSKTKSVGDGSLADGLTYNPFALSFAVGVSAPLA